MRTIRFGRTEAWVPAISLGTWAHGGPNENAAGASVGWSGQDDELSRRALVRSHELGINHWDTADVYGEGHSETLIGSLWNRVPRDEIFLASKVGWDAGGYDHFYHPELIRSHLDRSLTNLRTDRLDLYYFHHCDFGPDDRTLDAALELFHRFREAGKIRFIGLSDWDPAAVARLAPRIDPDVVQPYRNVLDDTYAASGLERWVEANDAGVAFFSPLMHGLLLGKYDAPTDFPEGDFRSGVEEFRDPEVIARTQRARAAIEERLAAHPEPVLHALTGALLAGSTNAAGVPNATVLLGQRNPRQVEAAATLGDPLDPPTAAWVESLYRG